ncbi:MAG: hypothetical protein QOD83_4267 [Solirubrobacteraceae bacterium]|nr:hypothetical protein [Solirubrobacteraceae bacterium]
MAVEPHTLPLTGIPDGVVAERVRQLRITENGEQAEVLVRRRHRRTDEVELAAAGQPSAIDLEPSERRWLLDAGRRQWQSVEARYGEDAWTRAIGFVRAGAVRLRCQVTDRMGLGTPRSWTLTDEWARLRQDAHDQRNGEREHWRARADTAARAVADRCPELAAALRRAPGASPTTPALIYAAEDLVQGVIHPSPRAFSQIHFKDTKARDDVAIILTRAGVPEDILIALGIRRSARIGIAGPVRGVVHTEVLQLGLLHGPVMLRVDQPALQLRLLAPVPLVIVENLQAAETLADQLPELAVAHTAGFPSDGALRLLTGLATDASRVVLVPDADLGGVRIAERVLAVAPDAALVDIGLSDHPNRDPWPVGGDTERALQAAIGGPADALTRGCLQRGYPSSRNWQRSRQCARPSPRVTGARLPRAPSDPQRRSDTTFPTRPRIDASAH